jgi:predicted aspartyl protease
METETMGRVLVTAKIENMRDLLAVEMGMLQPDLVRFVEVEDALVDTGASMLSMPRQMIDQLGLVYVRSYRTRTASGTSDARLYGLVKLTIQDRNFTTDLLELPDGSPVLIGQLPLEAMDWVVDMPGRRLIGNPDHGGEQMYELYSIFPTPPTPQHGA